MTQQTSAIKNAGAKIYNTTSSVFQSVGRGLSALVKKIASVVGPFFKAIPGYFKAIGTALLSGSKYAVSAVSASKTACLITGGVIGVAIAGAALGLVKLFKKPKEEAKVENKESTQTQDTKPSETSTPPTVQPTTT